MVLSHRPAFHGAFSLTATFPVGQFTHLEWNNEHKAGRPLAHMFNSLYALVHQVGNSLLFLLELREDVALHEVV